MKNSAFDTLNKGTRYRGQFYSQSEYAAFTRSKAKRAYLRSVIEASLKKLRKCRNIVEDWDDTTEAGFAWWKKILALLEPPPDLTIDQWADRFRRIPPEFAAEPGDWRTSRVSSMRAIMQACSPSHPARRVVLVKPVQAGGTEAAILNTIGFTIDISPRSILCIFPTLDLAESFSKERLDPMIKMIPRLNEKVADMT